MAARVSLTGAGIGQLRTIKTIDGKEIIERLEAVDDDKQLYRYTHVAGIPASRYTATIQVKPKGTGCVADWSVQFLASNKPDIVVRTMVSGLLETGLGSLKARFGVAK
jgi:Polyketide cyclase / dehydrase and lipid transport